MPPFVSSLNARHCPRVECLRRFGKPIPRRSSRTRRTSGSRATGEEVIENAVPVYRCPYVYLLFINSGSDNSFSKLRDRYGHTRGLFARAFVPLARPQASKRRIFLSRPFLRQIDSALSIARNNLKESESRAVRRGGAVEWSVCGQTAAQPYRCRFLARKERIKLYRVSTPRRSNICRPVEIFPRRLVASLARFQTSQPRASSIFVDSDLCRKTVAAFAAGASFVTVDRRSSNLYRTALPRFLLYSRASHRTAFAVLVGVREFEPHRIPHVTPKFPRRSIPPCDSSLALPSISRRLIFILSCGSTRTVLLERSSNAPTRLAPCNASHATGIRLDVTISGRRKNEQRAMEGQERRKQ